VRASMGLRTGEVLNSMCPGLNGPSDVDHFVHNKWGDNGSRLAFLEYKDGVPLTTGQRITHEDTEGVWINEKDGRRLEIRWFVLELHDPEPRPAMRRVVDWVWPKRRALHMA
jgi:hypothetical protein